MKCLKGGIHASVCFSLGRPALQAHEPEHLVLPGPRLGVVDSSVSGDTGSCISVQYSALTTRGTLFFAADALTFSLHCSFCSESFSSSWTPQVPTVSQSLGGTGPVGVLCSPWNFLSLRGVEMIFPYTLAFVSSCPITSCPSLVIYMCVLSLLAGCKLTLARTMCSMHSSQSLM